jgi:hypothetical protein
MDSTKARCARVACVAALAVSGVGCASTYLEARPSEPLVATAGEVRAEVVRVFLADDVRWRGLDADSDLVVELAVRNAGSAPRRISAGSFSCLMEIDARRPGETRALLAGGGGPGAFAGEPPGEGSLLAPLPVPPGETRSVWALFHGYRFDDSDLPRRITLYVPVEGAAPLALTLADPARGRLRWQTTPIKSALSVGFHSGSTFASGLRTTAISTDIGRVTRSGPLLWDVALVSTILVETQGPLVSSSGAFSGSGLAAHVTVPLLSWGNTVEPSELGIYAGGTAQLLAEIPKPRDAGDMTPPNVYGLLQAEAGVELDLGALRFAPTPFPLSPVGRGLPRWSLRVGYQQMWVDEMTSGGTVTSVRFVF